MFLVEWSTIDTKRSLFLTKFALPKKLVAQALSELCHCNGNGFGFINVHLSGDSKELTFPVHRLHFIVGPMESENENLVVD